MKGKGVMVSLLNHGAQRPEAIQSRFAGQHYGVEAFAHVLRQAKDDTHFGELNTLIPKEFNY